VFKLPGAKHYGIMADIVSVAEDENKQLFSLDTSVRGKQMKWPVFTGDHGEDFFKFKKYFLDAANSRIDLQEPDHKA
jgi:hypothetical protein